MVKVIQKCDFCNLPATVDGKTSMGPWAFMCKTHFERYGIKVDGLYSVLKINEVTEKTCYLCNKLKPICDFYQYIDHSGTPRYRNECKKCNLEQRKMAELLKMRRDRHGNAT